jgi:hypothetical protein
MQGDIEKRALGHMKLMKSLFTQDSSTMLIKNLLYMFNWGGKNEGS